MRILCATAVCLLVGSSIRARAEEPPSIVHAIIAADASETAFHAARSWIEADASGFEWILRSQIPASQLDLKRIKLEEVAPGHKAETIAKAIVDLEVNPEKDVVLFYYNGHGAYDDGPGNHGHLFTISGLNDKDWEVIRRKDIRVLLFKKNPRLVVMLSDCCASYVTIPSTLATRDPLPWETKKAVPPPKMTWEFWYLLTQHSNLVDLMSSKPGEWSMLQQAGQPPGSIFTFQLVKFLHEHRNDPVGWEHLAAEVGKRTAAEFQRQFPHGYKGIYKGIKGDSEPTVRTQSTQTVVVAQSPTGGRRFGAFAGASQDKSLVFIHKVCLGSPAEVCGLQRGDILVEINGNPVHREQDFTSAVDSAQNEVKLKVQRAKKILEMTATLSP
jgi:PDZ domain-containing protein/caspase domain-containing protein